MSTKEKTKKMQDTDNTKMFNKLLDELGDCNEEEQKQKIIEMNKAIDGMNKEEFNSIFSKEVFNKMDEVIEEEKLSLKNIILLLKHVGYCKVLKCFEILVFCYSALHLRIVMMIADENEKKEEKNKKLLIDLCECYLLLIYYPSHELISTCVPCLLKAASKKEEDEETQKEVEIALLALSNTGHQFIGQELYLNEIQEIILYHQEYQNLTRLAYQSTWQFLKSRLFNNRCLKKVIEDDLHFVEEATRELDELRILIDWKRAEKKIFENKTKEVVVLNRWLRTLDSCFNLSEFLKMENVGLDRCIIELCRASREYERGINETCLSILQKSAELGVIGADALLKAGVANLISEELQRSTLDATMKRNYFILFSKIRIILKNYFDFFDVDKAKRKEINMEFYEKLEENGYEDLITSFYKTISILERSYFSADFSYELTDCFVIV